MVRARGDDAGSRRVRIVACALAPDDWPPMLGLDSRGFVVAAVALLPMPFIALWMAIRLFVGPLEDPAPPQAP